MYSTISHYRIHLFRSQLPRPMSRVKLLKAIHDEAKHREPLEEEVRKWITRGAMWRASKYGPDTVTLVNCDGIMGRTSTLREICDEKGFKSPEDIDRHVAMMKRNIRYSRKKEKFMRHSYNRNHSEAEKCNEWLRAHETDLMELFSDNTEATRCYILHHHSDTVTDLSPNENGYMDFCKEMQKANAWREEVLGDIAP